VKLDSLNIYVYGYVDDFVIGGTDSELTSYFIGAFRSFTNTTEPVQNPSTLLGFELVRMRDKKVILVTMCGRCHESQRIAALGNLAHKSDMWCHH
jgi:hypothetical protein